MKRQAHFIFPLLLFLCSPVCVAQQSSPSQEFDEIVHLENTDLASGIEYIEQHIIRNNKHKYFLTQQFETGIVVYDGQTFINIPLKYNIYDDLLLVRMKNSGGEASFQLHKDKITEFTLANHRFRNFTPPRESDNRLGGFYEVLLKNSGGLLLKKHLKKQLKHLDRNFTYYEFETDDPQYVYFQNNTYIPIDSRRDIQELFPDTEKEIRRYYRSNRSLYKTDRDRFLVNLFTKLHSPVSPN